VPLQDRNDLLFRMPLALHCLVLSKGQTPHHFGSIQGGNVRRNTQPWRPGSGFCKSCHRPRLQTAFRGKLVAKEIYMLLSPPSGESWLAAQTRAKCRERPKTQSRYSVEGAMDGQTI
jgi:hypothetical protein